MFSSYHISRYAFTSFLKKSVAVGEVPEVVYGVRCGVDSEAFRVTRKRPNIKRSAGVEI